MKKINTGDGYIILTGYNPEVPFPFPKNPQITIYDEDEDEDSLFLTLNKTNVKDLIEGLTQVLQTFPSEENNKK